MMVFFFGSSWRVYNMMCCKVPEGPTLDIEIYYIVRVIDEK